jgi:hypothetical protein
MRNEELRKLDAALAEALGYEVGPMDDFVEGTTLAISGRGITLRRLPHYSIDPVAMLELDREMRERGYCVNVECLPPLYCAEYWKLGTDGNEMELVAAKHHKKETVARALAAHRALTGWTHYQY